MKNSVEVVHLVLNHARLETGSLHRSELTMLVLGAHAHVYGTLDVHGHTGYRETALLPRLDFVARPLDLRVG